MSIRKTVAIAAAFAALAAAAPALAGPAGEGRTFTVETLQKQQAARTVKVAAANQTCLSQAAVALQARDDVHAAIVRGAEVHVTFRSASRAVQGEADVRAAVARACA